MCARPGHELMGLKCPLCDPELSHMPNIKHKPKARLLPRRSVWREPECNDMGRSFVPGSFGDQKRHIGTSLGGRQQINTGW